MKTKIVATIGPKSESPKVLEGMARAGMDIARMNFSHCTFQEYKNRKKLLDKLSAKLGRKIFIMQDLQGPRLRVGELPEKGILLEEGKSVVFSTELASGKGVIHIDDPYLHIDIKEGDPLFLMNGAIEVCITKKSGTKIYGRVVTGGRLFSRKAVNVPKTNLTTSGLTQKDISDVEFGLSVGVDYVNLSFVQSKDDVERLRTIVGNQAKIVSKIERAPALLNIDEIIQASDAIMIGRGDLGAEVPMEALPIIQKNLIRHAAWHQRGSITATQMLLSMVSNPHPTRAEVSDVANAVLDGSDAVMLSDETASGDYPVESVAYMARIVKNAESYYYDRKNYL